MNFIYMLINESELLYTFDILNLVVLCIITLLYCSRFMASIIGFVTKAKTYPEAKINHRYAILIAARNEENVIGNLIDSIKRQDYPSELIDTFVVADNCIDNTYEVAKNAGAIVYARNNDKLKGKSYALDYLISKINEDYADRGYEAYFIFDADNLLSPNYIKEMNKAYDSGVKICTSFRDSKNFSDSWISANSAMMFYMESSFIHHTRTLFNIGTYVSGTGYYIDSNIIKENGGWIHHILVEDIEFSIDSALKGYKVMYQESAIFYDEQPITLKDSYTQRLRWCKGTHQCFGKYEIKLLWKSFKKNMATCLGLAIHICPAPIITFAWVVIYSLVCFSVGYANGGINLGLSYVFTKGLFLIYIIATCFFITGILVTIKNRKRMHVKTYKKIWYCITFFWYMAVYLWTSIVALFKKVSWKAIPHTQNKSIEELDNN